MNRSDRRARDYRPVTESLEARTVLSLTPPYVEFLHQALFGSLGSQPVRPNTPVAPFSATSKPTFIDPTVSIVAGTRMALGTSDYVAPNARLDARGGFIQVGSNSTIQDNANLVANPSRIPGNPGIIVGDNVYIGPGATILGPGQIGSPGGAQVSIGANAVIDHASVQAGAQVGALARVEPGVAILTGYRVLSGADVRNEAEATDPALGKVVKLVGTDAVLTQVLSDSSALATGYSALFQGGSATGTSIASVVATIFNGSLAPVSGSSQNPATSVVPFELSASPKFYSPFAPFSKVRVYTSPFYPFRAIGALTVTENDPYTVARHVGRRTSIRADEDQPITIASIASIGTGVTIHGSRGGKITVGTNLVVGNGAVLTANSTGFLSIGNDVNIGNHAVVSAATIGAGSIIGANSYVANSTLPAGATIAPGTILINNKIVGTVGY
jgi:carbonic anhydrase/acetyltransferase-like protein (isoleucine patch superfamily)